MKGKVLQKNFETEVLWKGGQWKGIIVITRGGMVPACILTQELVIPLIETFCIFSYDAKDQENLTILKRPHEVEEEGLGWLVIDDLVDTGKTFEHVRKIYPKAHFACLYTKPAGEKQTDTSVATLSQDTWIHFPWEIKL